MGQTRYLSKNWVFKNRFFVNVRKHSQHNFILNTKYADFFTKW